MILNIDKNFLVEAYLVYKTRKIYSFFYSSIGFLVGFSMFLSTIIPKNSWNVYCLAILIYAGLLKVFIIKYKQILLLYINNKINSLSPEKLFQDKELTSFYNDYFYKFELLNEEEV